MPKQERDLWSKLRDRWLEMSHVSVDQGVAPTLSALEESELSRWFHSAHRRNELEAVGVAPAALVDLAAWCAFGSTDLDLLPRDMRERDLEWAAQKFSVQQQALVTLICSASSLAPKSSP